MKFSNPTNLRVGLKGSLFGKNYRVLGRAVMSGMDSSGTYYWNEYFLTSSGNDSATLVYEIGEYGGEWRLVRMFDPEVAVTAKGAALVRAGDPINIDGSDLHVTMVAKSYVQFIEGAGPSWLKVGSMANYFNAKSGDKIITVSWTGEEVEHYRGRTLSGGMVESAFNIRQPLFPRFAAGTTSNLSSNTDVAAKIIIALIFMFCFFAVFSSGFATRRLPSVTKISAPPSPLTVGSTGTLKGIHYRIKGDDMRQIEITGIRFERHEYQLIDDAERPAILVFKISPNAKEWCLFTPLHPALPMSNEEAAAIQVGKTVNIDGLIATVDELFLSTPHSDNNSWVPGYNTGGRTYGFNASSGKIHLMIRWNEFAIDFYRGELLADKEVRSNFW